MNTETKVQQNCHQRYKSTTERSKEPQRHKKRSQRHKKIENKTTTNRQNDHKYTQITVRPQRDTKRP